MTQIIDAHVHFFPGELHKQPESWANTHGEILWKDCVAPAERPSIQGWATEKEMLNAMDVANVERVILQGWYWENQETCTSMNRIYRELTLKYPDRISAFAALQAKETGKSMEELKWIKDNGFLGIGELHTQGQGYSIKADCFKTLLDALADTQLILNFHVSDPSTKQHSGKVETPLADFIWVAEEYPDQVIILSHLGALLPIFARENNLSLPRKTIYYDTAAVPLLYNPESICTMSELVGSDKILFGTDYPLRVFPKHQKAPCFQQSVDYIKQLNINEAARNNIFQQNSKQLFRL